jgi:hypothetical protein
MAPRSRHRVAKAPVSFVGAVADHSVVRTILVLHTLDLAVFDLAVLGQVTFVG